MRDDDKYRVELKRLERVHDKLVDEDCRHQRIGCIYSILSFIVIVLTISTVLLPIIYYDSIQYPYSEIRHNRMIYADSLSEGTIKQLGDYYQEIKDNPDNIILTFSDIHRSSVWSNESWVGSIDGYHRLYTLDELRDNPELLGTTERVRFPKPIEVTVKGAPDGTGYRAN